MAGLKVETKYLALMLGTQRTNNQTTITFAPCSHLLSVFVFVFWHLAVGDNLGKDSSKAFALLQACPTISHPESCNMIEIPNPERLNMMRSSQSDLCHCE